MFASRLHVLGLGAAVVAAAVAGAVLLWSQTGRVPPDSDLPSTGSAPQHSSAPQNQEHVRYVVVPHPDDEFEAWSLVEHRPDTYEVFILATHGEETGFCEPQTFRESGWQRGLEPPPTPRPQGRWTRSCELARLHSWLGFFEDMGREDPTIPSDLRPAGRRGPFPAPPGRVCRRDQSGKCVRDTSAMVWLDGQGRGALVAFNLGDGDLTTHEVAWAVKTVQHNREALGIESTLPGGAIIGGSFFNRGWACVSYPNPDHRAVQKALRDVDFEAGIQAAPTCEGDPRATLARTVSKRSADAAFEVGRDGERLGAHTRSYGWLSHRYYPLDRQGQSEVFHTHQHFWVR